MGRDSAATDRSEAYRIRDQAEGAGAKTGNQGAGGGGQFRAPTTSGGGKHPSAAWRLSHGQRQTGGDSRRRIEDREQQAAQRPESDVPDPDRLRQIQRRTGWRAFAQFAPRCATRILYPPNRGGTLWHHPTDTAKGQPHRGEADHYARDERDRRGTAGNPDVPPAAWLRSLQDMAREATRSRRICGR